MTVAELLTQLLITHAHVLQRLAAYFGEEELFELLEKASEIREEQQGKNPKSPFKFQKDWFIPAPLKIARTSPYAELDGTVREMNLPAVLEFHLWAYPFYREWIESSVDLRATINPTSQGGSLTVQEALAQAKSWLSSLPVHPIHAERVITLGMTPWIRFQSEIMKKLGARPLNSL
jgi:hypothetical protein